MNPFKRAELPEMSIEEIMKKFNISAAEAYKQDRRLREQMVYMNEKYQVNVTLIGNPFGIEFGDMCWLSIKRLDKEPIHDWRDLQTIKNMIVGAECEAVELYPAESRLTDTANQYHIWCFLTMQVRFPFGFNERRVMGSEEAAAAGAKQRQRED